MSAPKSTHAGRKNNNDRVRELVALLGSLSSTGDSVSIDAISSRLGVTVQEATSLMNIVCQASGEEWGGLLISSNDEGTEFTLQYPGIHGRPMRLTEAETIALLHAMDLAGIRSDDPLRIKVRKAFSSAKVDERAVHQSLGRVSGAPAALRVCAQAQVAQRALSFMYQGTKDLEPRERRCAVRALIIQDVFWYVSAYDLDLEEDRTFRVDRITNAALGGSVLPPHQRGNTDVKRVGLVFLDKKYYTMFDWPGLRVLRITNEILYCSIPYYGENSTWLLRRICAGKGRIIAEDESIMNAARLYSRHLLQQSLD
ncbi:MAG: WYL domain-containing protein [Atopobiaceae bacterium]|jgi:proteasome accessory factor C|nr:WYL domain-containing protein [Atopobiaceae bacterium]